jgi:hypothetical protein
MSAWAEKGAGLEKEDAATSFTESAKRKVMDVGQDKVDTHDVGASEGLEEDEDAINEAGIETSPRDGENGKRRRAGRRRTTFPGGNVPMHYARRKAMERITYASIDQRK